MRHDLVAYEYGGLTDGQQLALFSPTGDELAVIYRQSAVAVTATVAQILPALGQTAAVDLAVTATVAQILPALGQTAAVDLTVKVTGAGSLPALTQTAAVDLTVPATDVHPEEEERFGGTPYRRDQLDRMTFEQQLERLLREDEEILLCL